MWTHLVTLWTSWKKVSFHTGSKVLGLVLERSRWCSSASIETYGSMGWSSATRQVFTHYTNTHFRKHSAYISREIIPSPIDVSHKIYWREARQPPEAFAKPHLASRRSCCAVSGSRSAGAPWPRTAWRAPCRWTWWAEPSPRRHTITSTLQNHSKSLTVLHYWNKLNKRLDCDEIGHGWMDIFLYGQ